MSICTTCPYCGVGCGVIASPDGQGGVQIQGDPNHPANFGRLCSKGSALGETVDLTGRLLHPMVGGQQASWDTALDLVAQKFKAAIGTYGPDSVGFYVSGQLLTEDYYVANKLMKGFIGSANIDTNSRLCMSSSVAGHKRAFGTDTVPGTYADIEQADLVVLVGSNLAWCHPVLFQRLVAARKDHGTKVVVIDPRRTASCDIADLHLPLKTGSDVALFNGLLSAIAQADAVDRTYLQHVNGFDAALDIAQQVDLTKTGLDPQKLQDFYDLWVAHKNVVTIYSQGVNQSANGTDKVNAILNCHLATGRIGRPGMGPFSVTGQPNAMGGREVGGLANMLACHLDIENPDHRACVADFWDVPNVADKPGRKAVDLFKAAGNGQIKALWIIHTNPAVSMPDAAAVRAAIKSCDFVVVSDLTDQTDTAQLADVVLPAAGWGEKDGTVTNSDRTISRQRAFLPIPGQARADWAQLAEVGRRMGWQHAFDYQTPAQIFREYAALSGRAGALGKDFDISGFSDLKDTDYATLPPTRWPVTASRRGGRFFADGVFYTPNHKAQMLAVKQADLPSKRSAKYPYRLNTGRIRDQWHTMTRSAKSPRLSAHLAEPFLELHPKDATDLGLSPSDIVRLNSPTGTALLRVLISDAVSPGNPFAPIHWTGETAPSGRIDDLVTANVDPFSGQPDSKASVVSVEKFHANWYGYAITTQTPNPNTAYWAKARVAGGWRLELAADDVPDNWETYARSLLGLSDGDVISVLDKARGHARIAILRDGIVVGALFAGPDPIAVSRDYLAGQLGQNSPRILAGRPGADMPDPGPTLCSCFGVGVNTILTAIETQGLINVDAIGVALQAGTNCGSCKPELTALLGRAQVKVAAE
ncbi:molybdopterin-dependent oxidoreductase [Aestuariibius sp. HNIBRBA575]|uniref:molybdopterin-dependent oxidoreductase n=1 Tax=Aestuariibius sp. HNIBRBA575 TaxID=3233343 RepID=UPI0034A38B55